MNSACVALVSATLYFHVFDRLLKHLHIKRYQYYAYSVALAATHFLRAIFGKLHKTR